MRTRSRGALLMAIPLTAALMAAPAAAQSVAGTLTQEEAPLAGVRVVLLDAEGAARAETVTDLQGRFTLTAPGPGSWRVRAEPAGRAPILSPTLPLAAGQTREFRMRALPGVAGPVAAASGERGRAVAVSGVTATAREGARDGRLREFYQRAGRAGSGRFLTREDIERMRPRTVPDLLRNVPGLVIVNDGAGAQVLATGARPNALGRTGNVLGGSRTEATGGGGGGGGAAGGGGGSGGGAGGTGGGGGGGGLEGSPDPQMQSTTPQCRVAFYLDGVYLALAADENITAHVTPDQVEGVEVYPRASMVPTRYQRLNNDCGAVLIWTRERM